MLDVHGGLSPIDYGLSWPGSLNYIKFQAIFKLKRLS